MVWLRKPRTMDPATKERKSVEVIDFTMQDDVFGQEVSAWLNNCQDSELNRKSSYPHNLLLTKSCGIRTVPKIVAEKNDSDGWARE